VDVVITGFAVFLEWPMWWIPVAILAVPLIILVVIYNGLIAKKNQVANVFGTIDVMLKKRFDLIPQLVATVKGYMKHEREVLEEITQMRTRAMQGISDEEQVAMDGRMTEALNRVMLAVENYPDLKASGNFMHLQRTLVELEEQISAARRAYNAAVMDYNNAVEMFPTNIVAGMMSYKTKRYFEIPPEERAAVKVEV